MPAVEFPNLVPILPELFLACAAMALLMLGVFSKNPREGRSMMFLSILTLVLTLVLVWGFSGRPFVTLGGMFITDSFSGFAKWLIIIAIILTLLISRRYLELHHINHFEYPVLVLLATLGMMMMVSANDLMALYMGLELQSLALYVLAAFHRDDLRSTEAGLKYFVLGALASGLLLYGCSLVYGYVGTTNFTAIAQVTEQGFVHGVPTGLVFGIVFVIAGLAFKVSAVPFHMWTPDVYEGAPTPVTALFAAAPKIAALLLLVRVLVGPFGGMVAEWQQVIVFISLASMVLGAFAAIAQTNIKRMMAYSSIGHMGYALVGLAAGTEIGVSGVVIYVAIYLFMSLGAFACILSMRRGDAMLEDISELSGLSKTHPALAAVLAVFMFSAAGIPPLAGFFSKLYVFLAAIEAELYTLAVIGVLSSVVGAFYYLRIVKVMYFDEATDPFDRPLGREAVSVLVGTGAVILLFFLLPGPIVDGAAIAAASLFAG